MAMNDLPEAIHGTEVDTLRCGCLSESSRYM